MTTDYLYRVAILVPDAEVNEARNLSEVLGYGRGFSCALSENGLEPATWWGLSTIATATFVGMLTQQSVQEQIVAGLGDPWTMDRVGTIIGSMTWAIGAHTIDPDAQFDELLTETYLMRVGDGIELTLQ